MVPLKLPRTETFDQRRPVPLLKRIGAIVEYCSLTFAATAPCISR